MGLLGLKKLEQDELKDDQKDRNKIEEQDKSEDKQEQKGFKKLIDLVTGGDEKVTELFPYKKITKDGYLLHKNGQYQVFLKVRTFDLQSMNDNDLERLTRTLQTLFRVYIDNLKLISMTYPTETKAQQAFQRKKIDQYQERLQDPNLSQWQREGLENKRFRAMEELQRMEWAENNLKDLTYLIVLFGESIEELEENIRTVQRIGKRQFSLEPLKKEGTLKTIVKQLMNMNKEI